MASPASVDAFRALSPDKQREALGRMSPEGKQALLQGLQTHTRKSGAGFIPPGGAAMPTAPPHPWAGQAANTVVGALPAVGATIGGIAGSPSGPGAVLGATLGAEAGEASKQLINRVRGVPAPPSAREAARDIGGAGLGGAASEVVGQGLSRAIKPVERYFGQTAARSTKIPLLPSEAGVGGAGSKTVEGFVGHALPSRGIMEAFRERQMAAATNLAESEAARLSAFKGTPEEAGQLYQKALAQGRARMKAEVNSAYKAIDDLTASQTKRVAQQIEVPSVMVDESGRPMSFTKQVLRKQEVGGVQPETREVKRTAIRLMREIQQQEKLMDPTLLNQSKSLLSTIIKSDRQVPYATMADTRSDLLAITRKLDEALPGKRAGMAKLLAGQMDTAMMDAAEKSGITGLPQQIRIANDLSKEMHRKFEQDLFTKVLDSNKPEVLTGFVRKAGLQELRDLNATITPAQRKLMQSQVLRETMTEGMNPASKELDPQKFAKGIYDLGDERGKELFGNSWGSVRQLADMVGRVRKEGALGAGAALHNYVYLRALPVAGGAVLFGRPEAAAALAGGVGAETMFLRGLAKALTNPAKAARIVQYVRLGAHGAPYAIYGIANLASSELAEDTARSSVQPPPPPKALATGTGQPQQ